MRYSETWWQDGMAAVLTKWGPQIDWALEQLPEQPPWLTRGLVAARVWYETRGVSHVTSADPVLKEKGLLQLSADSVAQYGIDPFDPESNLRAGVDQWTKWARAVDTWCRANGITPGVCRQYELTLGRPARGGGYVGTGRLWVGIHL